MVMLLLKKYLNKSILLWNKEIKELIKPKLDYLKSVFLSEQSTMDSNVKNLISHYKFGLDIDKELTSN